MSDTARPGNPFSLTLNRFILQDTFHPARPKLPDRLLRAILLQTYRSKGERMEVFLPSVRLSALCFTLKLLR